MEYQRKGSSQRKGHSGRCSGPPVSGVIRCAASFRRYYYDGNKCVSFTYGGCGETPNNFRTKQECENMCMRARNYHHS
ncbi:hypothetical protein Y032_0031g2240 [Ancylostoma ceylanicum]|nr:hypothetical protein Y032_0031g2240 [Ancylostoma ceylanicum]